MSENRSKHFRSDGSPKRAYETKAAALEVARKTSRPMEPMRAYRCRKCKLWHVGHLRWAGMR